MNQPIWIVQDLPKTSDLKHIQSDTLLAIKHPCDNIITRTTVGDIVNEMSGRFNKRDVINPMDLITNEHRLDLCDIYWWLMGLKAGGDHTFSSQMTRLKDVIEALRDKNK